MYNTLNNKIFWSAVGIWSIRLLTFISTIFLARLLTPKDFGLIATCYIAINFFESISRLGTEHFILHKSNISSDCLDTAWTLQLIVKTFISFLIFLSSSFSNVFSNQPEIANALKVMSILPLLDGLSSLGRVILTKEMNFKNNSLLETNAKVVSLIFTILAAYWLKNYWAFIIGSFINQLMITFGSYFIHPWRPKIKLSHVKEQWEFTKWIWMRGVLNFLRWKLDQLLISKYLDVGLFGQFVTSQRIRELPAEFFLNPLTNVLLPLVANTSNNNKKVDRKIYFSICFISLVSMPLAILLAFNANYVSEIILGDPVKWKYVSTMLEIMAPLIFLGPLNAFINSILTVLGYTKKLFLIELYMSIITIILLFYTISKADIILMIFAVITLHILSIYIQLVTLKKYNYIKVLDVIKTISICSIPTFVSVVLYYLITLLFNYANYHANGLILITLNTFIIIICNTMFLKFMFKRSTEIKKITIIILRFTRSIRNKLG